jgi:hypothetical protein
VAKLISTKGPGILQSPNRLGELPLHFCVSHGNLDLTRYLLSKGADLNSKDKTGWTSLHVRLAALPRCPGGEALSLSLSLSLSLTRRCHAPHSRLPVIRAT